MDTWLAIRPGRRSGGLLDDWVAGSGCSSGAHRPPGCADALRGFARADAPKHSAGPPTTGSAIDRAALVQFRFTDDVSAQLLMSSVMSSPGIGSMNRWTSVGFDANL